MNLRPGDVLIVTTNISFVKHVGVCVLIHESVYVLHNSPSKINKFGGNVVLEQIDVFMQDRNVLEIIQTSCTSKYLLEKSLPYIYNRWDAKNFNCENFINDVTNLDINPTQSQMALAGVSVGVVCFFLFI